MDNIYLILVIALAALAVSGLIVGVSNDAVNFLNSAVGAKAAPKWIILLVASIGILAGAVFSDGMMEVARKGIFYPGQFTFHEIMIVFLAVMITDVILLDLFNTFGLPTSTTVSIVFGLLGGAVAVAVIKISETGGAVTEYINAASTLTIVSGILLSIVIAFFSGAIVQYITRLIFSFNYKKNFRYFGAIWGGIAISGIIYFLLIKGAKGSSLISDDSLQYIKENTIQILLVSFIGWTILLQLLSWLVRLDILKLIVIVGTFALAMAFAGNDLVNFIGVPLAGFESFKAFIASGASPEGFSMEILSSKIKTDSYLLVSAGLIMAVTLWLSRKSRSVSKTEINLGRQDEGFERFGSSALSRSLVRGAINLSESFQKIFPPRLQEIMRKQFDQTEYEFYKKKGKDAPSFDMLRASVNLTVASMLIAAATSLKLPLSTTYVTFMVAMGTSLSDKAWGRESAVYRITGVTTVVFGWFITAFIAFTVALLFAFIINAGGIVAVGILLLAAIGFAIKTHFVHRKREKADEKTESGYTLIETGPEDTIQKRCTNNILSTLSSVSALYSNVLKGLMAEDHKALKLANKEIETLNQDTKALKNNINITIDKLQSDFVETGHFYVQVLDYLREIAHSLSFVSGPAFDHVNNNHKGLHEAQKAELEALDEDITRFHNELIKMIQEANYVKLSDLIELQQDILSEINELRRNQIKRIKHSEAGTRNSLLYLNILQETKNLLLQSLNLLKAHRDFMEFKPEENQAPQ